VKKIKNWRKFLKAWLKWKRKRKRKRK